MNAIGKSVVASLFILFFLWLATRSALSELNWDALNPYKRAFEDFSLLDIYYANEFYKDNGVNPDIILVNAGRLDRLQIAELLSTIQESEPRVIGVDIVFRKPNEITEDSVLRVELERPNVVCASVIRNDSLIQNHKSLYDPSQIREGYTNFNFENNSRVVRRFQSKRAFGEQVLSSFSMRIFEEYLGDSASGWASGFDWTKTRPIKYYGSYDKFISLDHSDVLQMPPSGLLKDKIVLVGFMGEPFLNDFDIEDRHYSPMNASFSGKTPPDLFGILIHGTLLRMLLEKDVLVTVPGALKWAIYFVLILLFVLVLVPRHRMVNSPFFRFHIVQDILMFFVAAVFLGFFLFLLDRGVYLDPTKFMVLVIATPTLLRLYWSTIRMINRIM